MDIVDRALILSALYVVPIIIIYTIVKLSNELGKSNSLKFYEYYPYYFDRFYITLSFFPIFGCIYALLMLRTLFYGEIKYKNILENSEKNKVFTTNEDYFKHVARQKAKELAKESVLYVPVLLLLCLFMFN